MLTTMTDVLENLIIKYDNISFNLEDSNADSHKKLLAETVHSTRAAAYTDVQKEYHKHDYS